MTVANPVNVDLSGDDLQITAGEASKSVVQRHLIIEAVVTSDLGENKPWNQDGIFYVDNLKKVAADP